jgi:hypothetical protein
MALEHVSMNVLKKFGLTMLHASSDNMECGMWDVECRVMNKREM